MRRLAVPTLALLLAVPGAALAQEKLSTLIPLLYGPDGLKVNSEARLPTGETHSAHFNSSFQTSFAPFNAALASQLASVPLPSPAAGFTFTFDPALGVFNRTTQSFGPLMSDRAETLGKNRVSLGFSYQRYTFDTLDGQDLSSIPSVFTHDNPTAGTGRDDLITTVNSVAVEMAQFTAFVNYGIGDRVDVSAAIPFVAVDLSVSSLANVQRIGTVNPAVHYFFEPTGDTYGEQAEFRSSGSASGLGDISLRFKAQAIRRSSLGVALGVEGRLPTGDEKDLLGSGAYGVKPFLVVSSTHKLLSPHLKLAYQWNGKTTLAGDPTTGLKGDLADEAFAEGGVEVNLAKKVTLNLEVLGRRVIDGQRMFRQDFRALNNRSVFPNVGFSVGSYNLWDGAVGIKANPGGNLLIDLNVVFKLNDAGLRDRVTPLMGVEYSF